ncbi:Sec7-domain-containing protein, partial [Meira miltonrushii]
RSRRSSVTSTTSTVHSRSSLRSLNKGSAVFVVSALEQIAASKEAKGNKPPAKALREAALRALELVRSATQQQNANVSAESGEPPAPGIEMDPRVVFEPLRLACQTRNTTLIVVALDCLGKLVSYSFFAEDAPTHENSEEALSDVVTSTVCESFYEGVDEKAQLQIIKALVAVVLSTSVHVHQSSLLKAVRTVYNIFLHSKSTATQAVAQGVLTQMVHHVFGRVPRSQRGEVSANGNGLLSPTRSAGESEPPPTPNRRNGEQDREAATQKSETGEEDVTLKSLEGRASFEGASERDTGAALMQNYNITQSELFVKDAFLVLRALCKLSMKPVSADSERDLKSQAMRSKLLSMHLILTILRSHISVFTDPSVIIHSASTGEQTPFVHATKQYLCLSLSRNAVSSINQVFEISCEIFWIVLSEMRTKMKKEIEVLINEIFLPILEMRNSTAKQKSILLTVFIRLCRDPQALVEIYLNYDCDRTALDNIYERLINVISRLAQTHIMPGTLSEKDADASTPSSSSRGRSDAPTIPPTLSTANPSEAGVQEISQSLAGQPIEVRLKRQSLESLCSVLRSLVIWSGKSAMPADAVHPNGGSSFDGSASPARASFDARGSGMSRGDGSARGMEHSRNDSGSITPSITSSAVMNTSTPDFSRVNTPDLPVDDPTRFETAKERKTMLMEGIKRFNFKPKRGIDFLIQQGFIPSREPIHIARFLLYTDGLNKAQIGEYLGEGDAENIAYMHAFADLINFERMSFTDALRKFLHAFRLPGESQKIDRFMLKFAERYMSGNPKEFANADTAYVFAYSVVMLNTDAHNPQVKHRMTLQDFIKNNSGIDDGKNLADEYLAGVYDEIQKNEIKMKDEIALPTPTTGQNAGGFANAIAAVGRDLQREAYVLQSESMASKTEALFRTMVRTQRRIHPQQRAAAEQFYSASHFEHVRPMFEVAWMAFLSGISGPLQETDDPEVVGLCLDAFKDAIRIVCLFGMELERNAFVTTLAKFTFLNNLGEMKGKNVEAIKALLGIALTEGNYLKGSWHEVLTCVSQLERFQLISGGVDERSLPELGRRASAARKSSNPRATTLPTEEVVQAGASSEVTVAADRVFSSTPLLSGTAIVDFVQALSDVSWEEIQSSGMSSDNPRLFSLQKLVEISYYNMNRIRMEWSNIWLILGNHFNAVCTHSNGRVSSFGLDSLRQLSNRFLEKEELPHFKFQKDFLKPFEYTMRNNRSSEAKELVLQCLQQMMASRIHNMRSGWRTMFGTLGAASKASERVASYAFELVRQLNADHFGEILTAGAFADLTVCLTDFAKASHAQRVALQSVSMLRGVVPKMLAVPECPIDADVEPAPPATTPMIDDPMVRFWFPALFAFYDIIMNGDDLEVRRVALDALFEILKKHGTTFRLDFWDTVCQEVLFPIFAVLRSRSDVTRFSTQEDMSVWLSTTMIQALRNLIDLWTHYFRILERLLPGLLDLLCACICQENDTLARIGTSCLQALLEKNVRKLNEERWGQVVDTFVQLYKTTTAVQLFDPALRAEHVSISPSTSISSVSVADPNNDSAPMQAQPLSPPIQSAQVEGNFASLEGVISPTSAGPEKTAAAAAPMTQSERRRAFKQIIVKCVLQLLLIETTNDLLSKGLVYDLIPSHELLRLMGVLEDSFRFSRKFNADKELRTALWKVGFMRQLPNLLKQESSSAATLIHILVKMHRDTRGKMKAMVSDKLVPLSEDILVSYLPLDIETQARNITAWTPVVVEVLSGLCSLLEAHHGNRKDDEAEETPVTRNGLDRDSLVRTFYPLAVDLLGRESLPTEISRVLQEFFGHAGFAMGIMTASSERDRKKRMREIRDKERV